MSYAVIATPTAMPLQEIGLSSEVIEKLRNLLSKSAGLLVVSGPEGSERTTTAHSLLRDINTPDRKSGPLRILSRLPKRVASDSN